MSGENTAPRVEPGIGRSLERARKSRGLSLWQVEQETRIRSRYLHDLERENFDMLPAVYVLGSLRTYANFLGLDGAALSRQLKASLVEPGEPGVPEQLATIGDTPDEDDGYEAAPAPAVGLDQLFLGVGVILVSILAVMTIVTAVAQGDQSPVSQINQPSTPEVPSETALAGNVEDGDGVQRAGDKDHVEGETREDQPGDEALKNDEAGEEGDDEGEKDDGGASRSASLFGDVEFVPMSPSSPTPTASASASSAPAGPTSASPSPRTAEPDDPQASAAPASTGASPEPAREAPDAASPTPASAGGGGGSPQAGGGGGGQTAPAGEADSDLISAEAGRRVTEAFDKAGIVR